MKSIKHIAEKYDITLVEEGHQEGMIRTKPHWSEWPNDMLKEVQIEGWCLRRVGIFMMDDDFWF